jgi:catechol 2,3-dioxygenase-like lactoylglutathione lyase family enzyme
MSDLTAPILSGLHHLKIPVSNLGISVAWYERVFGARQRTEFDHRDRDNILYAVIMDIPGLGVNTELRLAPKAARAVAGYDPVTYGVANRAELDRWATHLDACKVDHSPIITGYIGHVLIFSDPDGLILRLYTNPEQGLDAADFDPSRADIDSPWLQSPLMTRYDE